MKTYAELLEELGACEEAVKARQKITIEQALASPQRGDWLLWLASRLKLDNRKIVQAAGRCAGTVRHLIADPRSLAMLDACESYGRGQIDRAELAAARAAEAAWAARAAAEAAGAAAEAAWAAAEAAAAEAAGAAEARTKNRQTTGRIVAELLGDDLIAAVNARLGEVIGAVSS